MGVLLSYTLPFFFLSSFFLSTSPLRRPHTESERERGNLEGISLWTCGEQGRSAVLFQGAALAHNLPSKPISDGSQSDSRKKFPIVSFQMKFPLPLAARAVAFSLGSGWRRHFQRRA